MLAYADYYSEVHVSRKRRKVEDSDIDSDIDSDVVDVTNVEDIPSSDESLSSVEGVAGGHSLSYSYDIQAAAENQDDSSSSSESGNDSEDDNSNNYEMNGNVIDSMADVEPEEKQEEFHQCSLEYSLNSVRCSQ